MGVEAGVVVVVEVEVGEVERRPATVGCSGEPNSNLWFLIKMTRIMRIDHNYKASLAPECESGFLLSGGYT